MPQSIVGMRATCFDTYACPSVLRLQDFLVTDPSKLEPLIDENTWVYYCPQLAAVLPASMPAGVL